LKKGREKRTKTETFSVSLTSKSWTRNQMPAAST
jgi:hypothetical protein